MKSRTSTLKILTAVAKEVHNDIYQQALAVGESDLCGWCAKASMLVFERLKSLGLFPTLKVWQKGELGHCYVECGGYLVDITGVQFGLSDIEIKDISTLKRPQYWSARRKFDSADKFVEYLIKNKWHPQSIPCSYLH